ncbi:MAG TPA: calcium-binding protein [Allosphingosinicella sp.]|jgi:Ca2+-binding RTX toxin-like protein
MATINGTSGDDTLTGTSSSDQIFGLDGNDTLSGGGGNDQLNGGTGADAMAGGTGSDIYFVDDAGDSVFENSGEGNDEVRTTLAAYALGANLEKLKFTGTGSFTGTGNDLHNDITGGASDDTLSGGDGYDQLYGAGGNDSLYGGTGGDLLSGGAGDDYMEGGSGDDVYIVDSASDSVVEASAEGIDHVYATLSTYTLGANVENLTWNGSGAFTGTGNALDNAIWGGGSDDVLDGGDGNDTLRGQGGDDTLIGGNGDDLLIGASGADTMTGGAGADTFRIGYYESGTFTDADTIADFAAGTDKIDVSGWDANTSAGGDQAFTFVGTAAFSGAAGELRYYDDGVNTYVLGDINGDSFADFEIVLNGVVAPTASDFIL